MPIHPTGRFPSTYGAPRSTTDEFTLDEEILPDESWPFRPIAKEGIFERGTAHRMRQNIHSTNTSRHPHTSDSGGWEKSDKRNQEDHKDFSVADEGIESHPPSLNQPFAAELPVQSDGEENGFSAVDLSKRKDHQKSERMKTNWTESESDSEAEELSRTPQPCAKKLWVEQNPILADSLGTGSCKRIKAHGKSRIDVAMKSSAVELDRSEECGKDAESMKASSVNEKENAVSEDTKDGDDQRIAKKVFGSDAEGSS
jgi:hypothetical protein